jgi:transposase-like protein
VMMYMKSPLSLRDVEDLLFERGIDDGHETVWCPRYRRIPRRELFGFGGAAAPSP